MKPIDMTTTDSTTTDTAPASDLAAARATVTALEQEQAGLDAAASAALEREDMDAYRRLSDRAQALPVLLHAARLNKSMAELRAMEARAADLAADLETQRAPLEAAFEAARLAREQHERLGGIFMNTQSALRGLNMDIGHQRRAVAALGTPPRPLPVVRTHQRVSVT